MHKQSTAQPYAVPSGHVCNTIQTQHHMLDRYCVSCFPAMRSSYEFQLSTKQPAVVLTIYLAFQLMPQQDPASAACAAAAGLTAVHQLVSLQPAVAAAAAAVAQNRPQLQQQAAVQL